MRRELGYMEFIQWVMAGRKGKGKPGKRERGKRKGGMERGRSCLFRRTDKREKGREEVQDQLVLVGRGRLGVRGGFLLKGQGS